MFNLHEILQHFITIPYSWLNVKKKLNKLRKISLFGQYYQKFTEVKSPIINYR